MSFRIENYLKTFDLCQYISFWFGNGPGFAKGV